MQASLLKLLFYTLRIILRLLPLRLMLAVGARLGRRIGHRHKRDVDLAKAQLELIFPEKSSDEIESLIEKMFSHVGESIAETLAFEKILKKSNVKIDKATEKLIREHAQTGNSAFLLSAHIGNFELLAAYLASQKIDLSVIGRLPNLKSIADILVNLRRSYHVDAMWRENPKFPYMMLKLLKRGSSLALLIDQDADLGNDFIEFFGISACMPSAVVRFAMKNNKPLYAIFIARESRAKHAITSFPLEYKDDSEQEVQKVLKKYNHYLENLINKYPEQWPWWHRRWRRRPGTDYLKHPEKLPSRKEYLSWLEELKRNAIDNTTDDEKSISR